MNVSDEFFTILQILINALPKEFSPTFSSFFRATDDKGPVLAWLHAIEAFQKCGVDIPVNLKFTLEGMEESGSDGFDELLVSSNF